MECHVRTLITAQMTTEHDIAAIRYDPIQQRKHTVEFNTPAPVKLNARAP